MESLRIAGVILGVIGLAAFWLIRFRLKRLRNLEWLVGTVLSFGLILLGFFPNIFNSILGFFSFTKGQGGRIIGLLAFSNALLFLLTFAAFSRCNHNEFLINRLVRALAKNEFRDKGHSPGGASIYVVIPAYNEAENIGDVLKRIPEEVCGLRTKTLVVVDGGTDNTAEVARKLDKSAITHTINRGSGAAHMAGYEMAIEDGVEIVVTLDSDGQHQPEEMERLVQPIVDGEADLVNGSRVLGHGEYDSDMRRLGVVFFNRLISLLTMTRVTDSSNCFRAIRTSELAKLDLRQAAFPASELVIDALKKGLRFKEVPITITLRSSGETKKPPALRYGFNFLKTILATWLR